MDLEITNIFNENLQTERVVLTALNACNLNSFVLFDSTYDEDGDLTNKERHLMVFPSINLKRGDTVTLYTKVGRNVIPPANVFAPVRYIIYWGLDHKVWNTAGDKAYLLHYDEFMRYNVI
jgi:hypothetical protein